MKVLFKILSVLLMATFIFSSCSKDDDPADNDLFVGNYDGSVGYVNLDDESSAFTNNDGRITVVKIGGDNYNFIFRDEEIPNLMNITMQKGNNNSLVFEDGEGGFIRITASDLTMGYIRGNETWTADCSR